MSDSNDRQLDRSRQETGRETPSDNPTRREAVKRLFGPGGWFALAVAALVLGEMTVGDGFESFLLGSSEFAWRSLPVGGAWRYCARSHRQQRLAG